MSIEGGAAASLFVGRTMSQADFLAADSRMNKRIKVDEVRISSTSEQMITMLNRIEVMGMLLATMGTLIRGTREVVGECFVVISWSQSH